MKKTPLLLLFLLVSISIYSQKEANFWYFGNNAALDFNTGTPVPVSNSQLNTTEGCSSFSNANGELLFYVGAPSPNARNLTIWNRDNVPMPFSDVTSGGQTLKGDSSSSQSALTVPAPKKNDIYYLFTVGAQLGTAGEKGFWYYTIDMTKDGSFGDIVDGPVVLHTPSLKSQWSEKVTAVRGDECNTFWVISFSTSGSFFAYKVDENGVDKANPVISTINNLTVNDPRGYLKVSPDGTKLALANMTSGAYLFNFDDKTGRVTNYNNETTPQLIRTNFESAYGVEFSASSRRMYVSTGEFSSATENLYQFDVTKPTMSEVNNSRFTVHTYFNARGALQLGPDSKIYWTSHQNNRISVINKPEELGAACDYSHLSVSLGGATASQGLPPFLSSLLLPIEITDNATGEILNNTTEQNCIGESLIVVPESITAQTGTTIDYEWYFNNGATPIATTSNLTLPSLTPANAGDYRLSVSLTDNCGNATTLEGVFKLEVYQPTSATQPNDIFYCDTDNDGFNTFDLQATVTPQVLNGQSNAIYEVKYFLSQADANSNSNAIANPYTNPTAFSNQTIYARMHNIIAPNACFDVKSFQLVVTGNPNPQTPVDYEECDDTANGGDTDGFFNNFLLNSKDNEILGTLPSSVYEVSYHTTLAGANTDKNTDVIDKNTPYRNATANSQTIYVRVENRNNSVCNDTSKSFNLVVNPLPVIVNDPVIIRQCDTDADLNTSINLTLSQMNISANHANETFKYYPTQNDAINDTAEITNITAHPVTNGDVIWVRTISNKNCYRISRVEIIVGFSADVAYNTPFETCDDFLDADGNDNANNDDTDGITTFNISSVVNDVKALFPAAIRPNLDVLIFETIADRDAVLNAIPDLTNYRNKNVPAQTPQPLYIKIINTVNNDCTGIGSFTIWAQQPPISNKPLDFELCDDFNSGAFDDGINVGINLRDRVNTILGPTQTTGFTVTFHTSAADANTGNNPIPNDTNYTNQTKDRETIYVRVVNNTTGCFNDHVTFDIIINPLPTIANTIPNLEVCDVATPSDGDPRNRLAQNIDLSQRDADILNGRDPNLFEVSYHRTLQNAIDGVLPLSKTNYSNDPATTNFPANLLSDDPATEIIHISLLDRTTGCRYGIATLQLVIMPEPNIPLNIVNYIDCDNESDASNDDTNGVNGDITLKNKIPEILANYPTTDHGNYKVTFHSSLADAQSGSNPLDENKYENTANNQTIHVRVVNTKTSCVHDDLNFNIVINPLPAFIVDTPVIVCLNNPQTRLEPINPNATYSYEWTIKGDPNVLSTDAFLDVLKGGTYVVTATMQDGTGCSRSREIIVNESIAPTLNDDDIVIVDDTNNNGLDNYSIKIITENQNLGIGDYEFAIVDEDNNMTGFQDDPLFNNIYGGFYNVIVRDKNGCKPDAQLKVSVIEYPKFITPNGDGKNDTWKIKGADSSFYPSSNITVVDRYGKIVAIIPIDSQGWDGTYKGKVLPSSDYWFKIQLVDRKGKMHQHQGHFSILRK
ncbi:MULTISPECIES: T9SS type B sorting domain-containing protein [unclassified Tenacibaculum]|uniref:T9SS type B sorting domain-containing protein n=2 Tax=Tenacibaculum TaxID=104267 RepID=UPI001F2DB4C6|nr:MULTISPECIES: T9SS type B sorting domain-containing protein [unclassified Tenacibaculum]MCF2874347.1 T9SS type B sorting domain-containing protein [Tenacibaculum sp. Cn5-1]MCF2934928.1 T9SS type B sorting domain-containing protein [Tenacibaculum sp. Cn5-34]MCG7511138.1 T9SS type B sorting domain-containing protein [Tenacibaculum sp. Cn5-46]